MYSFKFLSFLIFPVLAFVGCITINEGPKVKPVPNFTANNDNCHATCAVTFQNTTIGEKVQYQWDFGDSSTSVEENPTHEYTQMGTYSVKLTAQNTGGAESISKNVSINAPSLPTKCNVKSVSITSQNTFGIGAWDLTDYPDIYVRILDNLGNTYLQSGVRLEENGANLPILINTFYTDLNFPDNTKSYTFRMYDKDEVSDQIMEEFTFTPNDYMPVSGQTTSQFTLTNSEIMMVVVLEWTE